MGIETDVSGAVSTDASGGAASIDLESSFASRPFSSPGVPSFKVPFFFLIMRILLMFRSIFVSLTLFHNIGSLYDCDAIRLR